MNLLSDIGSWCSIFGLLLSVVTIIYSQLIQKSVSDIQQRVLYNIRLREYLENLRNANYEYSILINKDSVDNNEIREKLKILETTIKLLLKIIPKDQQRMCRKCLYRVSKQYSGRLALTKKEMDTKKWLFSYVSIDDLKITYIEISALITTLTNLKIDKDIIS